MKPDSLGKPIRPIPEPVPEWVKTDKPGVWRSRITGRTRTWIDETTGKPKDGAPDETQVILL